MTLIHATIALALALFAANAAAAEPAMLRLGSVCFKSDDPGNKLPCDPRTADADQIAGMEWVIRDNLKTYGDLDDQAAFQAWLAATGNTFAERKASFGQEPSRLMEKLIKNLHDIFRTNIRSAHYIGLTAPTHFQ